MASSRPGIYSLTLRHVVPPSRPKNLGEVSAQDHTVQVLTKTLASSNASPLTV